MLTFKSTERKLLHVYQLWIRARSASAWLSSRLTQKTMQSLLLNFKKSSPDTSLHHKSLTNTSDRSLQKKKQTSHTFFLCGRKTSWALCYVRHSTSVMLSFSHFHLCVSVHVGLKSEVCDCYLEEHTPEIQSYNFYIYNINEVIIQYQKCVFCPQVNKQAVLRGR